MAQPDVDASWQSFRAALGAPDRAQGELLREIVARNADTDFGRAHGFASIRDVRDFQRSVPVARFADLAPYIDRVFAGERDVLFPGAPIFFARTSGTTGRPKHIPFPERALEEYRAYVAPATATLERDHPGASAAGMFITAKYQEDTSPGGVPIGAAGGFGRRVFRTDPLIEAVYDEERFDVRYYAVLRVALTRPLRSLGTVNPSTLLTLFAFGAKHADALAKDVADGTARHGPPGADELLAPFRERLGPMPEVAARVRASMERGAFDPRVVWPELRVLRTWKGGSTKHYVKSLSDKYPELAIRSCNSGSSEACLLVPLSDASLGGAPALRSTFFEFLPDDAAPDADAFVPIDALEAGRGYRLCVTNFRGMYRHLMDDVFFVEGREDATPTLYFSHRTGLSSSLTGEKLTEQDVLIAVEKATARHPLRMRDYQLAPTWGEPPWYLLQIELDGAAEHGDALARFVEEFEAALRAGNSEYDSKRQSMRLGAPELVVLAPGEFDRRRRDLAQAAKRSDAQSKVARIARDLVQRDALRAVQFVRAPA